MPAPRPIYSVSYDAIALTAARVQPVLDLRTPATTGAVILAWWVEFDGVTATNTPVKVEVGRWSAAPTAAPATAITPARVNHGNISLASQCTCNTGVASASDTTNPTDVENHRVPPTSGFPWLESLGQEWVVGPSSFWRMRLTAAQAVNATVGVRWTE